MRVIKVPADRAQTLVDMEVADMDAIRRELGGYPERVIIGDWRTRTRYDNLVMLVNDIGALREDMDVNERASVLYGTNVHGGLCYGDALLVGEGWQGEGEDAGIDFCDRPEKYSLEFFRDLFDQIEAK